MVSHPFWTRGERTSAGGCVNWGSGVTGAGEAAAEVAQPVVEHDAQPVLDADPQAQLFAVAAEEPKKPRRPRNTAKKNEDTAPVSDQKPLA